MIKISNRNAKRPLLTLCMITKLENGHRQEAETDA